MTPKVGCFWFHIKEVLGGELEVTREKSDHWVLAMKAPVLSIPYQIASLISHEATDKKIRNDYNKLKKQKTHSVKDRKPCRAMIGSIDVNVVGNKLFPTFYKFFTIWDRYMHDGMLSRQGFVKMLCI